MKLALEMRASVRCEACSTLTPLPGVRNRMSCRNCAAPLDFAARAADAREGGLRHPFGGCFDAVAEAALLLSEGDDCRDARRSQGTPVALRRAMPTCRACDAALPLPPEGSTDVACPQCGDIVAVRWPDEETRSWDPRLHCVIGDGKGRGDAPTPQPSEGVYIKCGHCGAPTATAEDERTRARRCTYCGGVNYLSDEAWLALFPEPEWHRCTLLYALTPRDVFAMATWIERETNKYFLDEAKKQEVAATKARMWAEARAELLAAARRGQATPDELEALSRDPELTEEEASVVDSALSEEARRALGPDAAIALVRRFARSSAPELRALLARHPNADSTTLATLAGDPDEAVRLAVAAHPATTTDVLRGLRKDPSEAVVEAVKNHPRYEPSFLEKLFG